MRTGREYLRVSKDRSGRLRSPAEQHTENREAADRRGVQLGEPYAEAKAVGASRYSRGTRDDFEQLLADITAGQFRADELWLWESSRGSRQVGEWVALIEACEAARIEIWVTTHSQLYDPANPRHRRAMLEDAVDAEYETAKSRERVLRAVRSRAAAGRPHGKLLYGYRREYDPGSGEFVRQVPDEAQAPIVREVFRRAADGDGITAIAGDLTRRGVPTPDKARVWRASTLRGILTNRGHLGERASSAGHATVAGAWPPLVDDTLWWRVQARLADHDAPRRDTAVKHLLSGLAVCDVCGGKLVYNPGTGRNAERPRGYPGYICSERGCLSRLAGQWSPDPAEVRGLEGQVVEFVLTLWDDDPRLGAGDDPRIAEVDGELRALRAELKVWQDSPGTDGVTPASVAAAERRLIPKIETLEQQLRVLQAHATLPDLGSRPLRAAWPALTLAQQRTVIAASVSVRVLPVGRGRRYDPGSVVIVPRWAG